MSSVGTNRLGPRSCIQGRKVKVYISLALSFKSHCKYSQHCPLIMFCSKCYFFARVLRPLKPKLIIHPGMCAVVQLSSIIASLVKTVALTLCSMLHPPDPSFSALPHSCVVLVVNELWQGLRGLVKTHTWTGQDRSLGLWTHTAPLTNCLTALPASLRAAQSSSWKTKEEERAGWCRALLLGLTLVDFRL